MFRIRSFQAEDAPALIALKADTIRRINSRDYSPEQIAAWAPDETALANWPERVRGRHVVVAEGDGEILGFGDVGPDGHIDQLFVHADHQGRGVGRAIMRVLLAEAERRGIDRVFSEVSITARPFFEANGFAVDAEQVVTARGVEFKNFRMYRSVARR